MLKWIVIALGVPAAIVWFATTDTAQRWAAETKQCDIDAVTWKARQGSFMQDLRAAQAKPKPTGAEVARLQERRRRLDGELDDIERRCK